MTALAHDFAGLKSPLHGSLRSFQDALSLANKADCGPVLGDYAGFKAAPP